MLVLRFSLFLALAVSHAKGNKANNVCPTMQDYATIGTNSRCWYNPDVNASPKAISKRYGFRTEHHKVITPDGYILTLYRVVPLNGSPGDKPILMHHGIAANAAYWYLHGKTSIPFYLASIGYDVWLSNARGTEVSMRHVELSAANPEFWDFSWHEIALSDVPATLDYIRKMTGGKKITFIGHSMGGTIQYVYASMMPDHAKENVNALVSLAPVVYTKHMQTEVAKLIAPYSDFVLEQLVMVDLYGTGMYPQIKRLVDKSCSRYPLIIACVRFYESLCGRSDENFEPEAMPVLFRRYPASFSARSIAHFGQEIRGGGQFRMFDFGSRDNLLRYNLVVPKQYDLRNVNIPCYIIYGENDLLADEEDAIQLFHDLETEKYIKAFRGGNGTIKFAHMDFMISKSMMDLNQYLAEILEKITSKDKKLTDEIINR